MKKYTPRQLQRSSEDLAYMVRFAAAARYVDDAALFSEFLTWLVDLLEARDVPKTAVVAGLESLHALPELRDSDVDVLFESGLALLA